MSERRQHSDILIAALLMIGLLGWGGTIANRFIARDSYGKLALFFVAAFSAAYVGRRILDELRRAEAAIAIFVSICVLFATGYQHRGNAVSIEIVAPILLAQAGAVVGALVSRYRAPIPAIFVLVAAGACTFGAGLLVMGLTIMLGGSPGAYVLFAAVLGAFAFTALHPAAAPWHSAVGSAWFYGSALAAAAVESEWMKAALASALFAMLFGAAGGYAGSFLRRRLVGRAHVPEAQLPEAHQVRK